MIHITYGDPKARDAWVNDERIRRWFEIVVDAAVEPHQHRACICKGCWLTFSADEKLWTLKNHMEDHERGNDQPYSSSRPDRNLTGEQVVSLHRLLFERFDAVIPEAGTWKFECKACKRRFPHRTVLPVLLLHERSCEAAAVSGLVQ
jgi:hypothetical protein